MTPMSTFQTTRLTFGEMTLLEDDLVEVVVDDGIEMDVDMVREYHRTLTSIAKPPFRLLVNKRNRYSYTFEAQLGLVDIPNMGAIAVLSRRLETIRTTRALATLPRVRPWHLRIFQDRRVALMWLARHKGGYACALDSFLTAEHPSASAAPSQSRRLSTVTTGRTGSVRSAARPSG